MAKLYTKYGDTGVTYTSFHSHTPKDHIIIKLVGDIDELNCNIGFCASFCTEKEYELKVYLQEIQSVLFEFGALVGYSQEIKKESLQNIVKLIETKIDDVDSKNEKLKNFILPGGNHLSSMLHVCRSVARRVERTFVEYINWNIDNKPVNNIDLVKLMQIFINRTSDYFFAEARSHSKEDIIWKSKLTHK